MAWFASAAAVFALSLAPVGPIGVPGSGITRLTGHSPLAGSCLGPGAQRGSEVEPSIAASAGGTLVAAWQQDRYRRGAAAAIGVAVSADGGASWRSASVPLVTDCTRGRFASDPWVSIGAGGVAYVSSLSGQADRIGFRTRVAISVSRDGGSSWASPALLDAGGNGFNDKPSVTADPVRPGRAWAVWALEGQAFLSRTDDGGSKWSPPRLIGRRRGPGGLLASTITVLPDGALLHTYIAYGHGPLRLEATRSVDRGDSWGPPVTVAPVRVAHALASGERPPVRALPASGTGPAVTGSGDVYEAVAGSDPGGHGQLSIVRSSDGGRSWSPPQVVVRRALTVLGPALVGGPGSSLSLTFYAVEPGARAGFWIARSADGGRHWQERRLGAPFSLRRSPVSEGAAFLGDYSGLTATPGGGWAAAFAAGPPLAAYGPSDVLVAGAP